MQIQCACFALFETSEALQTHVDEFLVLAKNLESFTSAQLQTYRAHFKPNNDDICEDDKRPGIRLSSGGKTHHCPHNGCDREEPFQNRKSLERHFERHCSEVYMLKSTGTRPAKEMETAESKHVPQVDMPMSTSKKRARNVMDDDQTVSGAPGSKLHKVDIINSLSFQHSNALFTLAPTALMDPSVAVESVGMGGFSNTPAEEGYANSMVRFDAPINSMMNYPGAWTAWDGTQ
ncbi:hypothetical protein V496_07244 [Pseudogymnoascus sp. VKM F-4515 (FW-2607)]|nr:hypothetical protein V496_07244 [Pseudogymnoascus sp. VKM F-4515 (FW-2607)]